MIYSLFPNGKKKEFINLWKYRMLDSFDGLSEAGAYTNTMYAEPEYVK